MSSNFRQFINLVDTLEDMGIRDDLEEREIFIFSKNTVYDSISAEGSSTSEVLRDLIVRLFKLEMQYRCFVHFLYVDGTRMILQGTGVTGYRIFFGTRVLYD